MPVLKCLKCGKQIEYSFWGRMFLNDHDFGRICEACFKEPYYQVVSGKFILICFSIVSFMVFGMITLTILGYEWWLIEDLEDIIEFVGPYAFALVCFFLTRKSKRKTKSTTKQRRRCF